MKMETENLRKKGRALPAVVRVGKAGVTDSLVEEIDKHLKKKKLIKVKFLKSATTEASVRELAEKISSETKSEIIMVMGLTAVFYREKRK